MASPPVAYEVDNSGHDKEQLSGVWERDTDLDARVAMAQNRVRRENFSPLQEENTMYSPVLDPGAAGSAHLALQEQDATHPVIHSTLHPTGEEETGLAHAVAGVVLLGRHLWRQVWTAFFPGLKSMCGRQEWEL